MRRTLLAPAAALALALALGTVAGAMPAPGHMVGGAGAAPGGAVAVHIDFAAFTPRTTRVLIGDTVTWANDSVRTHTVTADDGTFDSGRLGIGASFARRFDTEVSVPYHCEIHAGMNGMIVARQVLLDVPAQAAAPGRQFPLTGRAAVAPAGEVRIQADTGTGFTEVGRAAVQADGSFRALVIPRTTGRYRAVAGTASSDAVDLRVTDRRIAFTAARRAGGVVSLGATVSPAAVRAPVVLQLYLPERFGWWPVRTARLNRASRARFTFRLRRRVAARVLLTLPDRATPLAISATRRIGTSRSRR